MLEVGDHDELVEVVRMGLVKLPGYGLNRQFHGGDWRNGKLEELRGGIVGRDRVGKAAAQILLDDEIFARPADPARLEGGAGPRGHPGQSISCRHTAVTYADESGVEEDYLECVRVGGREFRNIAPGDHDPIGKGGEEDSTTGSWIEVIPQGRYARKGRTAEYREAFARQCAPARKGDITVGTDKYGRVACPVEGEREPEAPGPLRISLRLPIET